MISRRAWGLPALLGVVVLGCVTGVEGGPGDIPELSAPKRGRTGLDATGGTESVGGTGGSSGTGDQGGTGGAELGGSAGIGGTGGTGEAGGTGGAGTGGAMVGAGTGGDGGASPVLPFVSGRGFAVASGLAGVAYLHDASLPTSGTLRLLTDGTDSAMTLVTGLKLGVGDRVLVGEDDVIWSDSSGVSRFDLTLGTRAGVQVGSTPHAVHLAGATATHVIVARSIAGTPPIMLDRYTRTSNLTGEHICTEEYRDGAVDADGRLVVATASGIVRYDFSTAGPMCAGSDPGVWLGGSNAARVLAASNRIYFAVDAGALLSLYELPNDGSEPREFASAYRSSSEPSARPLAVADDTLFYVSDETSGGVPAFAVLARAPGEDPVKLGSTQAPVTEMAADTDWVYLIGDAGLARVARR